MENIRSLKEEISEISYKFNRKPEEIVLVAVSKTFEESSILEAYDSGLRIFGESRIQEAGPKIQNLKNKSDIQWHLVGHLQSNKVNKAVNLFDFIQSIDKITTLAKVNESAKEKAKKQKVLIEVNISGEGSKFGLPPEEVNNFIKNVIDYPNIELSGLMAIGPLTDDRNKVKSAFLKLKELYDICKENLSQLSPAAPDAFNCLSMGMSDDYEPAIECGSTMLRIGARIFRTRS